MSLLQALSGIESKKSKYGPTCGVALILGRLSDGEASRCKEVIDNSAISAVNIADALTLEGHRISASQIRRHRQRGTSAGCRCDK